MVSAYILNPSPNSNPPYIELPLKGHQTSYNDSKDGLIGSGPSHTLALRFRID